MSLPIKLFVIGAVGVAAQVAFMCHPELAIAILGIQFAIQILTALS